MKPLLRLAALCLGAGLLAPLTVLAQTTIAFQGFESSGDDTWSISSGSANVSSDSGTADEPADARIRTGSSSWQVINESATLELGSIDVSSYTGVSVVLYLSSTASSTGNGGDVADEVAVYVDLDGNGFPGTADLAVNGNNNARWSYSETTASATAGTPASFQPAGGGDRSDDGDGYSRLVVNIPAGTSSVGLRVVALNDAATERWSIDDVTLQGAPTFTNVQFSAASYTTPEGDAPGSFDLTVSIAAPSAITATTVDVAVSSATAAGSGEDYTFSTTTLTFPASSSADQTATVTITGDTAFEYDETITFTLQNVSGGTSAAIVEPSTTTLTITNDDTPNLVINEILADPATGTAGDANGDGTRDEDDDEFVEIVNAEDLAVDLTGYTLSEPGGSSHTFPSGTILSPGGVITVFGGGTPTGIPGQVQTAGTLGLNNSGDTVTLADGAGTSIDAVTYGSEGGDNQSLTREPDLTGGFVQHKDEATGSGGTLFSPGTRFDGTAFSNTPAVQIGGDAGWRMLAVPVAGLTVGDLAAQNLVQGVTGSYAGDDVNLYTRYTGSGWTAPASTSTTLNAGEGFIWYFFNNTNVAESVALPFTLSATGREPGSDVSVALHAAGDRWNLLGNPFAASLDVSGLSGWATSGSLASGVAQIWQDGAGEASAGAATTGSYVLTTTTGDLVSAWQGFFVENTDATGLTIPTSARGAGGLFRKRSAEPGLLGFELSGTDSQTGARTLDRALALYVRDGAATGWDAWDAAKLTPLAAPFATLAFKGVREGEAVLQAQQALPATLAEPLTLPLAFQAYGIGGTFTVRWPRWERIPETWRLTLTDQQTGTTVDLRTEDAYTFTAEATAAMGKRAQTQPGAVPLRSASGSARFLLTIDPGTTTGVEPGAELPQALALESYPNPFNPQTTIRFALPEAGPVQVRVYDALGRVVATLADEPRAPGWHAVTWNAADRASGLYLVRAVAGGQVRTQTVMLVK